MVLYLGVCLAQLGWGEFVEWGKGPIGRVLLSQSIGQASCDFDHDYSDDDYDAVGGVGGTGLGSGECGVGRSDFGGVAILATDPER